MIKQLQKKIRRYRINNQIKIIALDATYVSYSKKKKIDTARSARPTQPVPTTSTSVDRHRDNNTLPKN